MNKRTKKKKIIKYPGIFAAARELGVDRMHLYFVLRGDRKSKRIQESDFYRRMVDAIPNIQVRTACKGQKNLSEKTKEKRP